MATSLLVHVTLSPTVMVISAGLYPSAVMLTRWAVEAGVSQVPSPQLSDTPQVAPHCSTAMPAQRPSQDYEQQYSATSQTQAVTSASSHPGLSLSLAEQHVFGAGGAQPPQVSLATAAQSSSQLKLQQ